MEVEGCRSKYNISFSICLCRQSIVSKNISKARTKQETVTMRRGQLTPERRCSSLGSKSLQLMSRPLADCSTRNHLNETARRTV